MGVKKTVKQIIKKTPIVGAYIQNKQNEVVGLREAVKRLEDRNDEWAAEVRQLRGAPQRMEILWPVAKDDIIAADTRTKIHVEPTKRHSPPYTFNWIVPPVGSVSGGHMVIFRFINFLESLGHVCRVYFYDPMNQSTLEATKANLTKHHEIKAELFYNEATMLESDALIATQWTTAYPVFNYKGAGKKFYLIQDYETIFEPSGTTQIWLISLTKWVCMAYLPHQGHLRY